MKNVPDFLKNKDVDEWTDISRAISVLLVHSINELLKSPIHNDDDADRLQSLLVFKTELEEYTNNP